MKSQEKLFLKKVSLVGCGATPRNALQAVAALGERLEGEKFSLAENFTPSFLMNQESKKFPQAKIIVFI